MFRSNESHVLRALEVRPTRKGSDVIVQISYFRIDETQAAVQELLCCEFLCGKTSNLLSSRSMH